MSGIPRPRWPAAVSPLSMSILLFLEVLGAVLICMAPVSWPASGHPAGLVRGPRTPRIGRRSLYSAVLRGIQVFGYIPPHSRRSTGVLVTFHLAGPRQLARQG